MRCLYCGWDNAQGKENCEKCGKPLGGRSAEEPKSESSSKQNNHDKPTDKMVNIDPKSTIYRMPENLSSTSGKVDLKKTVREALVSAKKNECPICGLPLDSDGSCPSCGKIEESTEPVEKKVSDDLKKTKRPERKVAVERSSFTLTPISESTGEPEGNEIQYNGSSVMLNRDNTDPKNDTITSRNQAEIVCEDGKWMIKDESELKTTFVQAARRIELQKGDLILLGNQLFRFDV